MSSQRNRKSRKGNWAKQDVTLITLLANESTKDSRALLKEYNEPDAKNHIDLEEKLAQLYFKVPDKIEFEKKMAKIHPHRDWLLKYEEPKIIEKIIEATSETKEVKSNLDGKENRDNNCPTLAHDNNCSYCNLKQQLSSFDGTQAIMAGKEAAIKEQSKNTTNTLFAVLGVVGIIAILGMTLNKK